MKKFIVYITITESDMIQKIKGFTLANDKNEAKINAADWCKYLQGKKHFRIIQK